MNNNKKHKVFIALLTIVLFPLSVQAQSGNNNNEASNGLSVKISKIKASSKIDTLFVDFKLERDGKKEYRSELLKKDAAKIFSVFEDGVKADYYPIIDTLIDITNRQSRMDNIDIMLLIDRSQTISGRLLESQMKITENLVEAYGKEARVFISFMCDGKVTATYENVDSLMFNDVVYVDFKKELLNGDKLFFQSVLSKLQEMADEPQTYFKEIKNSDYFKQDKDREKLLFVFTDGIVKDGKGDFYGGNEEYYNSFMEFMDWMERDDVKIPVYCVYIGDDNSLDENSEVLLEAFSSIGSGQGFFRKALTPEALEQLTLGVLDSVAPDYQLILINPDGKRYDGSKLILRLILKDDNGDDIAKGEHTYMMGSKEAPIIVTHSSNSWFDVLVGLLIGILLLSLTYLVFQFLIPKIKYANFLKKYVVPFSAAQSGVEEQRCFFCKEVLNDGELVVNKCKHVVHKVCWDQNGGRCPEYGRHKCKTGIHYYNQKKLTDPKNATHFLPWILSGFIAGILAWLFFALLNQSGLFATMMQKISEGLIRWNDVADESVKESVVSAMTTKTCGWLQKGLCLGFFLVLAFSYVLEFRKMDGKIIGVIIIRAVVGALLGFVAMLLGSLVVILTGKADTNIIVDWIPYLFFALAVSLVLWYRTEIKLKSSLIGGCISVLFSFFVIYLVSGRYAPVIGYMIYAAGLGCSIAVVHYASEKYFLRVDGCIKERDIAIYKWMSVTGGFNTVSIGKSASCVLQMNWDDSEIGERVVELYLENARPFMRVMDSGVTRQGRSIPKGTSLPLTHGNEFSIGKTHFTYIEKDV